MAMVVSVGVQVCCSCVFKSECERAGTGWDRGGKEKEACDLPARRAGTRCAPSPSCRGGGARQRCGSELEMVQCMPTSAARSHHSHSATGSKHAASCPCIAWTNPSHHAGVGSENMPLTLLPSPHPHVASIKRGGLGFNCLPLLPPPLLMHCLPSSTSTHNTLYRQAHDHRACTCAQATVSLLLPLPRPPALVFCCASCLLPWPLHAFLPVAVSTSRSVSDALPPCFLSVRFYFHIKQDMLIDLFVRRGLRNCLN